MKKTVAVILFFVSFSLVRADVDNPSKDFNLCMQNLNRELQDEQKQEMAAAKLAYRTKLKTIISKSKKLALQKKYKKQEKGIRTAYQKKMQENRNACADQKTFFDQSRHKQQDYEAEFTTPQSQACENKAPPAFTADITDFSKVLFLIPPVTIQGNYLKGHGYIKISEKMPVYAPVDSTLSEGSYYSEDNRGQYSLTFEVTCDVRYMVDHLSEAIPEVANQFPRQPASDSRTQELQRIQFKAGDLIGYTIGTDLGKTWDFGVYNFTQQNPYNNPAYPDYDSYRNKNAVCPYAYYDLAKRAFYKNLMRNADGGVITNPTNLCGEL